MKHHAVIALLLASLGSPAIAATSVAGKWITAEHDSVIEIGQCGSTVCGRVIKLMKTMADGRPAIDLRNPDPALRGRSVQGITILSGFTDQGAKWKGRIYDPKSGKTYTSYLTRNGDGTLKVQGCIGFLCQAFTWTPLR